jgi:hypothetical protein
MPVRSPKGSITQLDGRLIVEPDSGMPGEIEAVFRELATRCIENQTRRVLVKLPDDGPAGERALRMALTTMVLAGLPAEFRLAMVAASERVMARYRTAESDLSMAGVEAKMFGSEDSAARWLGE